MNFKTIFKSFKNKDMRKRLLARAGKTQIERLPAAVHNFLNMNRRFG